jgi:hypothetical protein
MANTIKIKRSAVPGKVPTTGDLSLGELGLNTYDGKLFTKRSVGGNETIVELSGGGAGGGQNFTGSTTAPTSPADGDEWLDLTDGTHYTYVNDGNSSAWVELSPPQLLAPAPTTNLDGGGPSTVFGGIAPIDAGGVS